MKTILIISTSLLLLSCAATELSDLPTVVTKPDYEVLNNQEIRDWVSNIPIPTKPKEKE